MGACLRARREMPACLPGRLGGGRRVDGAGRGRTFSKGSGLGVVLEAVDLSLAGAGVAPTFNGALLGIVTTGVNENAFIPLYLYDFTGDGLPRQGYKQVTLPEELHGRLKRVAEAEGLGMPDLIRKMLGDLECDRKGNVI